jgi:16S rRNA (guanine966-N2)-methyltransferase
MDPPYDQELEKQVLKYLAGSSLVYEDTVIIVEASLNTDFSYIGELGFSLIKEKRYKTNKHVFLEKAGKEEIC